MRNNSKPKIREIMGMVEQLPYVTFDQLRNVSDKAVYLKILFSRYAKKGKLVRLKKGMYVSQHYLDEMEKKQLFTVYSEFLSNVLYQPSYLSLEYVLYEHNLLTEAPVHFTSVSLNKTRHFTNRLGRFFYHSIKPSLFAGFKILENSGFRVMKASLAKALFDFLYFRKQLLTDGNSVAALRLNLEYLNPADKREFLGYVSREGSQKIKTIADYLFNYNAGNH